MSLIIGLNAFHPDSAACALRDGKLVAAVAEERLGKRLKHVAGFPALALFWNTGHGLILQSVDAEVCRHVQRRLRHDGIPCLSIHDSFVVPPDDTHVKSQPMRVLNASIFAMGARDTAANEVSRLARCTRLAA